MANEWKVQLLEDCMAAIIDYRGKTPKKTSSGIPLITAKVVKAGRIEQPDEFIAEDDYEAWMRRGIPESGDVLVTTEAPLGEVAQLGNERVALAQRLIALRGKPGVLDNTFLKTIPMRMIAMGGFFGSHFTRRTPDGIERGFPRSANNSISASRCCRSSETNHAARLGIVYLIWPPFTAIDPPAFSTACNTSIAVISPLPASRPPWHPRLHQSEGLPGK